MKCGCGCGIKIADNRRFSIGHHRRNVPNPRKKTPKERRPPKFGGAVIDESLQWKELSPPPQSLLERFWGKVKKTETCWFWMGSKMRDTRYGQFAIRVPTWRGGASRPEQTHRLAYEFAHGPIPKGMVIMHTCDVPICVNPDHLRVGTQADNIADKLSKGRHHWGHKLSPQEIRSIRNDYGGRLRQEDIAKRYGISRALVSLIGRRKIWVDIE